MPSACILSLGRCWLQQHSVETGHILVILAILCLKAINDLTGTIPTYLFIAFQGTFAAIAVAIVSGSNRAS